MDAETAQEGGRVVGGGVTAGGIGVSVSPREDGCAINDQVARPTEATREHFPHEEDAEHLARRRARRAEPLALLARTRDAAPTVGGAGQPAGERERGPVGEPVVDVAIGEPPKGANERDQEQGFLAVDARCAARTGG